MTTNNTTNTSLSGQTGSGSFAGSDSPAYTTQVSVTNNTAASTVSVLKLINNQASSLNTGLSIDFQPNASSSRTASIRSLQTTAGNYADLEFYTCAASTPALAMMINTSQQILIGGGVTTALGTNQLQIFGFSSPGSSLISTFSNNTTSSRVTFFKSRSTSVGSQGAVQNGDDLGYIAYYADDGTSNNSEAARIQVTVSGSVSTGVIPTAMSFKTMNTSGSLNTALTLSNAQIATFNNGISAPSINFGGDSLGNYTKRTAWTPVFTFGTPGDLSIGSITNQSWYLRIGDAILLFLQYAFTPTYTTASGNAGFTGVPIASVSGQGNAESCLFSNTITYPVGTTYLELRLPGSSTTLSLIGHGSGASSASLTTTNFPTGVAVTLSSLMYYFAA